MATDKKSFSNRIEFLLFKLSKIDLAIEVSKIREVINLPKIHAIPGSHLYVDGVSHFRGTTIPVINLGKALRINSPIESKFMVVIDHEDKQVGLLIESVDKIVSIEQDSIQDVPSFIKTHYLASVAQYDNRLREILDVKKILTDVLKKDFESLEL